METHRISDAKYFLLPAVNRFDQQFFFVLSRSQVVEILNNVVLRPVPFSPRYIKGVALYHQQLVPVVCLEEMLGLASALSVQNYRQFIAVRSSEIDPKTGKNLLVIVAAQSRLHFSKEVPEGGVSSFHPCPMPDFLSNTDLIRGIFENKTGCAVIINFDKLLLGGLIPPA